MNRRKTWVFKDLVNDCIKELQNRFKPSKKDVEKRIEALIEKEYFDRDEKESDKVHLTSRGFHGYCEMKRMKHLQI